jgi:poly-gamma-glutamate synthesis protein (capsule biosynthesis protein)
MVRLGRPGPALRADRRTALLAGSLVVAVLVLTGCTRATAGRAASVTPSGSSAATGRPVKLAFAGDVHFEGSSAAALDDGVGSAAEVLRAADLAFVNLETAVTDGGNRQPKQYAFRAPARAFDVLRDAGVDAVSMANNHGMDYGRAGLSDSLAAAKDAEMPVLGAGVDDAAAYAPLRRTVRGVRVSVFAATDVLDSFAVGSWPALADRPGLAVVKDAGLARLADAVRVEKADHADVVAVVVHWGVELVACPSARQQEVAQALADAGADVVAGSHAHVLQPTVRTGRTVVAYGLGNFVFYARDADTVQSGVLTVTVTKAGVRGSTWSPALITSGRPMLLTGAEKTAAVAAQKERGASC